MGGQIEHLCHPGASVSYAPFIIVYITLFPASECLYALVTIIRNELSLNRLPKNKISNYR